MWLRVLGSAAGGGLPQWNCTCPTCGAAREGRCRPRSQSSVAVSADRRAWFLLNASPDLAAQVEGFPALHPQGDRTTPIRGVLLTDAELDHTLGLLLLREAGHLDVHATPAVHAVLCEGTSLLRTLGAYCEVRWHRVHPGTEVPLAPGLTYRAVEAPTAKAPRFAVGAPESRVVGYRLTDTRSGSSLVHLPVVQQLTAELLEELGDCHCLLFDGTCWSDRELAELGLAEKTSRDMGHLPIDGPGGSLEQLTPLPIPRKVYVHLNNTNPIVLEDSPERLRVEERGMEVAADGLELEV